MGLPILGLSPAIGRRRESAGGAPTPPAAPTVTVPSNNAHVFNGFSLTLSATSTDGDLTRIDWVLDPGGGETVVATDSAAPYSQPWTPTGVALGTHTLVARAVRGALTTDSAPITVVVDPVIFTRVASITCVRAWQSDLGLTPGGTPLASGTGPPPAITFTGALLFSTTIPAIRIQVQTTGSDGVATIRYGIANTGSSATWIEQNIVVPAGGGTYAAIGALSGLVLNFPSGTYTNDNVYQSTCAAWLDLKNGFSASQATPSKQPLILVDASGRPFLRFDGVDDVLVEPVLNLAAPATTNVFFESGWILRSWTANKTVFASGTTGGTTQIVTQTASPQVKGFNSTAFTAGVAATLGTLFRAEALFTGSVNDVIKIGPVSSGTGTSTGNGDPAAGLNIGAATNASGNAGPWDVYNLAVFTGAGGPSGAEKTAMDGDMVTLYTSPAISV